MGLITGQQIGPTWTDRVVHYELGLREAARANRKGSSSSPEADQWKGNPFEALRLARQGK